MDITTFALCKKVIAEAIRDLGQVFTIRGEVTNVNLCPMSGNKAGDVYLVGPKADHSYDEYYWNTQESQWDFLGSTDKYVLPEASTTLGGVKTTSTVTDLTNYEPAPIQGGIVYTKNRPTVTIADDYTIVFHNE